MTNLNKTHLTFDASSELTNIVAFGGLWNGDAVEGILRRDEYDWETAIDAAGRQPDEKGNLLLGYAVCNDDTGAIVRVFCGNEGEGICGLEVALLNEEAGLEQYVYCPIFVTHAQVEAKAEA